MLPMGNTVAKTLRRNSREVAHISVDDELDFDLSTVFELDTLDEQESKTFHLYLTSRPLDQWKFTDMSTVIQAVRISIRLNRILDVIENEGYMLPGSTGETLVSNPLFRVYSTLVGTYGTLMTRLQLTPASRGESTSTAPLARLVQGDSVSHLIPRDLGE